MKLLEQTDETIYPNKCIYKCSGYVIIKGSVFMSVRESVRYYEFISVYIGKKTVNQQTTLIVSRLSVFVCWETI